MEPIIVGRPKSMTVAEIYDHRLADGTFGYLPNQPGCRGDCGVCYLIPDESPVASNTLNASGPLLQLPDWAKPGIRVHVLLEGASVPCPNWIGEDPIAQTNWGTFPWRLCRNEFLWGSILGDLCDRPEVRGADFLRRFVELAIELGLARIIVISTRLLTIHPELKALLKFFAGIPNVIILLGVTLNRDYERIKPEAHIRTLHLMAEAGIINRVAATRYPHIEEVCEDELLPQVAATGVKHYLARGYWMFDRHRVTMPKIPFHLYEGHRNRYHIPYPNELNRRITDAGLSNIPLLQFLMTGL